MDKAPIKNSEPLRAWALVVAGEAVTTTKAVIANAWRAAGLEVTELTAAHPAQQGLDAQEYLRGYRDRYNRRDAEVKGALV